MTRGEGWRASLEDAPPGRLLAAFVLINAIIRMALTRINLGEYTDGVLQVMQFEEPTALWPPLYGWLTGILSHILPGPAVRWAASNLAEGRSAALLASGRYVSAIAGTLAIIPIFAWARRAGGVRTAFFAALLYSVAPVPLRWSARMMSDALFFALLWAALERWDAAVGRDERPLETRADFSRAERALSISILLGAAASITRYQGVLILPLLAWRWLALAIAARKCQAQAAAAPRPRIPWAALICFIAFAAVPAWMNFRGVAHGEQFGSRLGADFASALGIISINAEAFLLLTPFFLTYLVAAWALGGIVQRPANPSQARLLAAGIYAGAAILLLQAAFSSFQERYMLPWYGFFWIWGGLGLERGRYALANRPRLFAAAAGLTLVVSLFVAGAVLILQREAFADFGIAARWLRINAPPTAHIYTNELYNEQLGGQRIAANKLRFFAGREVRYFMEGSPRAPRPVQMAPGDLLFLHSTYSSAGLEESLRQRYSMRKIFHAPAEIVPLFPDIMARPGTAQNPSAWLFRYEPQSFNTSIWRIEGPASP